MHAAELYDEGEARDDDEDDGYDDDDEDLDDDLDDPDAEDPSGMGSVAMQSADITIAPPKVSMWRARMTGDTEAEVETFLLQVRNAHVLDTHGPAS